MTAAEPIHIDSNDGQPIAVHDLGGAGPVVILCHATGFCGRVWEPLAAGLADRFHCLALDFRGHGHSAVPPGADLAWTAMADDLMAVVEAFAGNEPVRAVGHSMGATAIVLAESAWPGTFGSAWMFEPILFPRRPVGADEESPAIAVAARKRRAVFASRSEAIERWCGKPPLDRLDPAALWAYAEYGLADRPDGSVGLRCRPDDEATVFEHHNTGADELIAKLSIPILAAVGHDDGAGPAAAVRAVAHRHPGLELVAYPTLSHFGPLEAPRRLAADIAAFFAR